MKTLSTEEILHMLEGQVDVLTPMADEQKKRCESLSCPTCGGSCSMAPHPTTPFSPSSVLPNRVSKCVSCDALIDPDTKLTLRAGKFALVTPMS